MGKKCCRGKTGLQGPPGPPGPSRPVSETSIIRFDPRDEITTSTDFNGTIFSILVRSAITARGNVHEVTTLHGQDINNIDLPDLVTFIAPENSVIKYISGKFTLKVLITEPNTENILKVELYTAPGTGPSSNIYNPVQGTSFELFPTIIFLSPFDSTYVGSASNLDINLIPGHKYIFVVTLINVSGFINTVNVVTGKFSGLFIMKTN